MSTRSRIGIQNEDGTITSIYCHHDGYIDYVGKCLVDFYPDEPTIRKLMELGDMSSIGTTPTDNPNAWKNPNSSGLFNGSWQEQYRKLHPEDMCDTYKSRGEDCPAVNHKDVESYQKYSRDCWGEYTYLYKDGDWYVLEYDDATLRKVKDTEEYKNSHYFKVVN